MSQETQIAVITGGASGIGLGVTKALTDRKGWTIYILDRDVKRGNAAAETLGATFLETDVTIYTSLAACFKQIFEAHGKLNFVFANAGIALDPKAQLEQPSDTEPPGPPSLDLLTINMHSVIYTTNLAQHYLRRSPPGPRNIVITASAASLYTSTNVPLYTASKHGVLGWMKGIAPGAWKHDRISVSAICPGIVQTNILPAELFGLFTEDMFTPIPKIAQVVLMLLDNEDANNSDASHGQIVEISGDNHYIRKDPEFCDQLMATVIRSAEVDQ